MRPRNDRFCVFFFLTVVLLGSNSAVSVHAAGTEKQFIGNAISSLVSYGPSPIYQYSDSLVLNGRLLSRGSDYVVDDASRQFVLQITHSESDTLIVRFTSLPTWITTTYAPVIPNVEQRYDIAAQPAASFSRVPAIPSVPSSSLRISGSKSFRVASRAEGNQQFGQSLDLQVSGFLTQSVQLDGAITDRGYDPEYGTSTSRLRELDNVKLKLTAPVLTAQVGDIAFVSPFDQSGRQESRLYGFSASGGMTNWKLHGTAARARGRFTTKVTTGSDNVQGPYQITESNAIAIVPGSETVWLNGVQIERGADQGYTMEYPTGRITFSSRYPIDSRSRIEVDYEIAETAYRPSLLSGGAEAATSDSLVFAEVEWLQEKDGDNSLTGESLTPIDKQILETAGDNSALAVRSGVRNDSLGSYQLDSLALPDSVFVYVGKGNGKFSLTFRYAGEAKGSYRFIGSDKYQYVGKGSGEYLPEIQLSAPEQQSYYSTRFGVCYPHAGTLTADLRQSNADKNLFSTRDDQDNSGLFYQLGYDNRWGSGAGASQIYLRARTKEAQFTERSRLDAADFKRNFLLPSSFVSTSDERYYTAGGSIRTTNFLRVLPEFSFLNYGSQTKGTRGGGDVVLTPISRLELRGGMMGMQLRSDNATGLHGDGKTANASALYRLSDNITISPSCQYEDRATTYHDTSSMLTSSQVALAMQSKTETVRLEQYREDTSATISDVVRNRLMLTSHRRLGNVTYSTTITAQELTEQNATERNLLSDLDAAYTNVKHRLTVTTAYSLSHETRNARGITYLEVPTGQGTHRLENGQYIPDPDGNYVQVEEILSDRASVNRGRKEFQLQKAWSPVNIRFVSHIEEELLPEGNRTALWALPFVSDESQPYLFYDRRYEARLGLIPVQGVDVIAIQYADARQSRLLGTETKLRTDRTAQVVLSQPVQSLFFEERAEWFTHDRDEYYSGGGLYDGFTVAAHVRGRNNQHEYGGGVRIRSARTDTDIQAVTYAAETSARIRLFGQCEWANACEVYLNRYSSYASDVSYLLTDDHPGNHGSIWSSGLKYRVRDEVRIDAGISGRHADDRTARLLVKGEVLVTF